MRMLVPAIGLLLLVAGPTLAQEVHVDYDPDYSRSTIETFAWDAAAGKTIKEALELLHMRIAGAIEQHLDAGGLRKVDSDPDVFVTYYTSIDETVKLDTVQYGYMIPTGWYWGPYGSTVVTFAGGTEPGTDVKSYKRGTLVLDIWDAESKQLVWRGVAGDIAVSHEPKKIEKRLDKALNKIFAQWKEIEKSAP